MTYIVLTNENINSFIMNINPIIITEPRKPRNKDKNVYKIL